MHEKVPGLYMTSTVGLPYEHLTVLLGGHGYKKTVKNGNARYNCKIFTQYKFSRDQWKDKKIIYTALKCLLTKFECMYNYLIDSENTPKSAESFCQSLLDHITEEYVEAVMDGIDDMKENEHDVLSMVETRQICESEFIRHYQCLLTHKWKFENGHYTFKLEDFRSRLSLSESNNGICDVRAIAYNVVSSTIEPEQRFKNTAADCIIDVDAHGLGGALSMQPDLKTVDAGDKINVFNVHDVFRAFVSIYFQSRQVPYIFQEVLDDAKHLISNMKCYKTSSNVALKRLMRSCDEAVSQYNEFDSISELMLNASKHFITLLLHKKPSTDHVNFINYIADICAYLEETNEYDHDVTVVGIPLNDDFVVHFKFNDMIPRYKESITILTFNRIVAATQLQILASMRRIEHDPSRDISELQFKNYIQLVSDTEEGQHHESIPPTFSPMCNIDNLMDILYPDSIHDAMDTDSLYFKTLKTAIDTLNTRNSNPDHSEDDRQNFKKIYLKSYPPLPKQDEENPVIFVTAYIKRVCHPLMITLNENREKMNKCDIDQWSMLIRISLKYVQSHTKKIFDEDVNCSFKCNFKELSENRNGEREEFLRVVHDLYTLLKRKSYTNRITESEMQDRTAENIFNKHTTESHRMSKDQFYSAWNDIMQSKLPKPGNPEETPESVKNDVFNRLSRQYNYLETVDNTDKYIDLKSFKCLFLGNLKVNLYIEFVKLLYFHIQVIVNVLQADEHLRPDTFTVKDPTDREKKEDYNELDTNIERTRFFLASKYSEWWNFGSDDRNAVQKIMEARSEICDNIYTDKSADTKFIHSVFSYMNDIKGNDKDRNFTYDFDDSMPVVCDVKNIDNLEIDPERTKMVIGYKLPGEGEHGLQKKWGFLPVKIPSDLKSKVEKDSEFYKVMLYFTIHKREVIKIKLHDGTCVDVPLEPKLVCEPHFRTSIFDGEPTRVPMKHGRKYIWNFEKREWEQKREVWLMHRIAKIVDEAGHLHSALFSNDVVTAMQSLFLISSHVRHAKNRDIQQTLKKICISPKVTVEMGGDTLQNSIHVGSSIMPHLENLIKMAYVRGKKIETDVKNSDIEWDKFETHMNSTLRYTYPCLVIIFFEMLKCIQTQCMPSDKIDSIMHRLAEIYTGGRGSNGGRVRDGNVSGDALKRYIDLTTECFSPDGTRYVTFKEVYNEELSKSQLSVILSNYNKRMESTATSGNQHNYSGIPMTIANGNDTTKIEIKMLNFLIFDCMKIMDDMSQNLCLTKSDAVVSYATSEATRVHQIIQDNNDSKYDKLKEKIRNVYTHTGKKKLLNYNCMNKSDIIDFLQKKWLLYWDNVINLILDIRDVKDKFSIWTHYVDTFLNQLLDKNTEAPFGTFYLYIDGNVIRNILQKLRDLTWDNLDSLPSTFLEGIFRLINYKDGAKGKHKPIPFLMGNTRDGIVNIQHCKVLMSCSVSEIISDDVFHLNNDGHIKSCYSSKLSQEELKIARVYGEVVDRWLDLIFAMMNIQLSFFLENRKGIGTENWNPPASTQILSYFQKTQEYFRNTWENKTTKDPLSMSKFASTQKLVIGKLISEEWKEINREWKIGDNVIDVYKSYEKTKETSGILLKCDLKLFLWTVISNEVYHLIKLMGSMTDSIKTDILAIFNAAINNQITLAKRINSVFAEQMKIKYNNNYGAAASKTVIRHMEYIINVCRELYRLPDFTNIQDLTFMYMSEELNRIHMGPIH